VLRGWAVVLELRPYVDEDEPDRLRLAELDDGRRYRKHVLDLSGLGVRDLCPSGDDLLVLAGPTMDLDGPVHVVRWHGAMSVEAPTVVRGDALTREVDLPYGEGTDHAEGIGLLDDGRLLVVYDSPRPSGCRTARSWPTSCACPDRSRHPSGASYGRSSYTMLNGVRAASRARVKPASAASARVRAGPAWLPSPVRGSADSPLGRQRKTDAAA
jgi:hypothetical protein